MQVYKPNNFNIESFNGEIQELSTFVTMEHTGDLLNLPVSSSRQIKYRLLGDMAFVHFSLSVFFNENLPLGDYSSWVRFSLPTSSPLRNYGIIVVSNRNLLPYGDGFQFSCQAHQNGNFDFNVYAKNITTGAAEPQNIFYCDGVYFIN